MEPGKASRVKEGEDVELADVRLLSEPGEPSSQAHSWYSANGRGFTVNGRPTETSGGTSHVATVLGESFYARERFALFAWLPLSPGVSRHPVNRDCFSDEETSLQAGTGRNSLRFFTSTQETTAGLGVLHLVAASSLQYTLFRSGCRPVGVIPSRLFKKF